MTASLLQLCHFDKLSKQEVPFQAPELDVGLLQLQHLVYSSGVLHICIRTPVAPQVGCVAAALDDLSALQLQAPVVELAGLDTFRDQVQVNEQAALALLHWCAERPQILAPLKGGAPLFPILPPFHSCSGASMLSRPGMATCKRVAGHPKPSVFICTAHF